MDATKTFSTRIEIDEATGDGMISLPPEMVDRLGWDETTVLEVEVVGRTLVVREVG